MSIRRSANGRSLFTAMIAALLDLFTLPACASETDGIKIDFLSLASVPTPVERLLPDRDWQEVCYLDPYSFPSRFLPRYLKRDLLGYKYVPSDVWLDEGWNGLAFVDRVNKTIYVVPVQLKLINRFTGPRCIDRAGGIVLLLRDLENPARTVKYNEIQFLN